MKLILVCMVTAAAASVAAYGQNHIVTAPALPRSVNIPVAGATTSGVLLPGSTRPAIISPGNPQVVPLQKGGGSEPRQLTCVSTNPQIRLYFVLLAAFTVDPIGQRTFVGVHVFDQMPRKHAGIDFSGSAALNNLVRTQVGRIWKYTTASSHRVEIEIASARVPSGHDRKPRHLAEVRVIRNGLPFSTSVLCD